MGCVLMHETLRKESGVGMKHKRHHHIYPLYTCSVVVVVRKQLVCANEAMLFLETTICHASERGSRTRL